jgi:hypothetical protein
MPTVPNDVNDLKQAIAILFVAAMVNREAHNPANFGNAAMIADNACDLVDELEKQFKRRGWTT